MVGRLDSICGLRTRRQERNSLNIFMKCRAYLEMQSPRSGGSR